MSSNPAVLSVPEIPRTGRAQPLRIQGHPDDPLPNPRSALQSMDRGPTLHPEPLSALIAGKGQAGPAI